MHKLRPTTSAVSIAILSLGLAVGASAQTGSTGTTTGAGTGAATGTTGSPKGSTAGATSAASKGSTSASATASSQLSHGERKFLEEAAIGGMAEVQMGQLASQNAQSDQVKQFGQRMVTDHGKANDQLKQIASAKGVTLPTDLDAKHKRDHDRLAKLNGADFDRAYMKMMVSDHKKDVSDFRNEAKSAKDAEVKSFASSTLPTLEEHLRMAQSTEEAMHGASAGSKTGTASRSDSTTTGSTGSAGTTSSSGTAGGTSSTGSTGSAAGVTGGTGRASGTGTATAQGGSTTTSPSK